MSKLWQVCFYDVSWCHCGENEWLTLTYFCFISLWTRTKATCCLYPTTHRHPTTQHTQTSDCAFDNCNTQDGITVHSKGKTSFPYMTVAMWHITGSRKSVYRRHGRWVVSSQRSSGRQSRGLDTPHLFIRGNSLLHVFTSWVVQHHP